MTGLRLDDRKLNVEERARAWSVKAKGGTWMAKKYNMLNIKSLKSKKSIAKTTKLNCEN